MSNNTVVKASVGELNPSSPAEADRLVAPRRRRGRLTTIEALLVVVLAATMYALAVALASGGVHAIM